MSIYIYETKRSPIGKFKKSLSKTGCRELGKQVSKSLFKNSKINPTNIDKVYVGNVLSAGLGQNIARQILIDSDIPEDRCAASVNMVCGSGLKAINLAYNEIKLGNANCVLAGGVENMSMSPLLKDRLDENKPYIDSMINDSLSDIFNEYHMGITAENVAEKYNITREEQDQFALESQQKVQKAIKENKFTDEIVPIKTEDSLFETDEFPRADSSLEKLSSLKPVFKEDGTVTAGNASGINDGCAMMIIGNETVESNPLVEIIDFAELRKFINVPVKNFSSGMYARLGFSIATAVKPDILIVDEVLAVGDYKFYEKCERRIADMIKDGVTIIVVSHDMAMIERLCTKLLWLEHGKIRAFGDKDEICEQYKNS